MIGRVATSERSQVRGRCAPAHVWTLSGCWTLSCRSFHVVRYIRFVGRIVQGALHLATGV